MSEPVTESGPSKSALKKQAKAEKAAAAKAEKAAKAAASASTSEGKKADKVNEEELDPSVRCRVTLGTARRV
jgi:ribosomal protein S25